MTAQPYPPHCWGKASANSYLQIQDSNSCELLQYQRYTSTFRPSMLRTVTHSKNATQQTHWSGSSSLQMHKYRGWKLAASSGAIA